MTDILPETSRGVGIAVWAHSKADAMSRCERRMAARGHQRIFARATGLTRAETPAVRYIVRPNISAAERAKRWRK